MLSSDLNTLNLSELSKLSETNAENLEKVIRFCDEKITKVFPAMLPISTKFFKIRLGYIAGTIESGKPDYDFITEYIRLLMEFQGIHTALPKISEEIFKCNNVTVHFQLGKVKISAFAGDFDGKIDDEYTLFIYSKKNTGDAKEKYMRMITAERIFHIYITCIFPIFVNVSGIMVINNTSILTYIPAENSEKIKKLILWRSPDTFDFGQLTRFRKLECLSFYPSGECIIPPTVLKLSKLTTLNINENVYLCPELENMPELTKINIMLSGEMTDSELFGKIHMYDDNRIKSADLREKCFEIDIIPANSG